MSFELGLPAGTFWKNNQGSRDAEHDFRAKILLHQGQGEINPCGDPAGCVDIPVANEDEIGVYIDRRVCFRQEIGVDPVGRHAPMVQQTGGR